MKTIYHVEIEYKVEDISDPMYATYDIAVAGKKGRLGKAIKKAQALLRKDVGEYLVEVDVDSVENTGKTVDA